MEVDEASSAHSVLFPKALGQVLSVGAVSELHLSLSAGRWRHQKWSYSQTPRVTLSPTNSSPPPSPLAGPSGAELFVQLSSSSSSSPSASSSSSSPSSSPSSRHTALLAALSGLVCASLNTVTSSRVSHPDHLYPPRADATAFYSTLPREAVCTENLTPLVKLLPCRNRRGLGRLLHSLRFLNSAYHSLQLHWSTVHGGAAVLTVAFTSVVDPRLWSAEGTPSWTLSTLFDEAVAHKCEVADDSRVWVHLQPWVQRRYAEGLDDSEQPHARDDAERLRITPRWTDRFGGHGENVLLMWDLAAFPQGLSLALQHHTQHAHSLLVPERGQFVSQPPVLAHRYLTGTDSYLGRLHTELCNHDDSSHTILFYDSIPSAHTLTRAPPRRTAKDTAADCFRCELCCRWYVRLFFHTMEIVVDGVVQEPSTDLLTFRVAPSEHRGQPAELELAMRSEIASLAPSAARLRIPREG